MERKLEVHRSKSLRLENVLIKDIINTLEQDENEVYALDSIDLIVEQMENQIRSKGTQTVGPLIQYMGTKGRDDEEMDITVSFMVQANQFIHNVDPPFKMASLINVKDCMYVRFVGLEDDLQIAYQKLQVEAYENDIALKGSSYTVFVDADGEGDIVADIFMEKENVS